MTSPNPLGMTGEVQRLTYELAGLDLPDLEAVESSLAALEAGLAGEADADLVRRYGDPEDVGLAFRTATGREPGKRGRSRRGGIPVRRRR